jgi:hypothetical protein
MSTSDLTQEELILYHYAAKVKDDLEAFRKPGFGLSKDFQRIALVMRLVFFILASCCFQSSYYLRKKQ